MLPSSGLPSLAIAAAIPHAAVLRGVDTLPSLVVGAVLICFAIALVVVSTRRNEG